MNKVLKTDTKTFKRLSPRRAFSKSQVGSVTNESPEDKWTEKRKILLCKGEDKKLAERAYHTSYPMNKIEIENSIKEMNSLVSEIQISEETEKLIAIKKINEIGRVKSSVAVRDGRVGTAGVGTPGTMYL